MDSETQQPDDFNEYIKDTLESIYQEREEGLIQVQTLLKEQKFDALRQFLQSFLQSQSLIYELRRELEFIYSYSQVWSDEYLYDNNNGQKVYEYILHNFKTYPELAPDFAYLLGRVCLRCGSYKQGADILEECLINRITPKKKALIHSLLFSTYRILGDKDKAKDNLRFSESETQNAELLIQKYNQYMIQQDIVNQAKVIKLLAAIRDDSPYISSFKESVYTQYELVSQRLSRDKKDVVEREKYLDQKNTALAELERSDVTKKELKKALLEADVESAERVLEITQEYQQKTQEELTRVQEAMRIIEGL